ncbi:MAG: hypothetical protein ACSHX6_00460 [Akkermansiaceae bacterium]
MKDFIAAIKSRLNTGIALKALLISLIIAAAISLIWGLTYIFRGHAVSAALVYPIAASIAVIYALTIWFTKKKNALQSSAYADQFFHLKDSLTSAIEFEEHHQEGQIYELQRKQAAATIVNLSPKSIPLPISKKLTSIAALGVIAAVSIAFIPPSQKVLQEIQEKATTAQRTEEIKKSVEEEVENMIKSLSDEEKEAIDPDAIRQWVKELKMTDNKREALRNIARIEQKIQKSIDSLQNRKNEELLKNAGIQMLKAQDAAAKEMGKHLENKDFKKAAQKLEEFKLRKDDNKNKAKELDQKKLAKLKADAKKPDKKKALNEKQKQLAKLRQLTKRLNQAARQNKAQSQGNSSDSSSSSMSMQQFAELLEQHGITKLPEELNLEDLRNLPEELLNNLPMELLDQLPQDMLGQIPPELLEQLLELLENNAQELQEMMEEMELEMMQGEPMTEEEWEEFLEQLRNMDGDLEALKNMLLRMQAMKSMRGRLQGLKQGLGLAQGYANGQKNQSQFQMRGKGGKQPGTGSDNSRRKDKDKLENNQQYSKLKGQKGIGPSQSSIEDADSGTGSSSRQGTVKKRDFEHQMSSFIERDDVPEEMKQSVKQYFEDIHNTAPATPEK